jgi:hypothetical protein
MYQSVRGILTDSNNVQFIPTPLGRNKSIPLSALNEDPGDGTLPASVLQVQVIS